MIQKTLTKDEKIAFEQIRRRRMDIVLRQLSELSRRDTPVIMTINAKSEK